VSHLENPRHEALAQLMVLETDVPDGILYLKAGYNCDLENAESYFRKALREHPEIEDRVKEIKANLNDFRERMLELHILNPHDRKRVLSQIASATLGQFLDKNGEIDKRALNHPAIAEYKVTETITGNVTTTIKVRDPHTSIDLLNKMEHLYIPEAGEDNRPPPNVTFNILNIEASDATHLLESTANLRGTAVEGTRERISESNRVEG